MKEIFIYRSDILKRVFLFGLIGFVVLIGFSIRAHYAYLAYNFNGRVDSIRYGDKGDAIILIKQKKYILDGAWSYSPNNKIFIQKGDSMLKLKDSTQVKLISRNGTTIIH
jgi:hypothetical protein